MDDRTWARIAVQLGIINPGLADEFERTRKNLGLSKSLPETLKHNGLVTDEDIRAVEALEPIRLNGTPRNEFQREAMRYAKRCVEAGLLDEEKATESIRDLVIEGERRPLRELLIERRYATAERLDAVDGPAPAVPAGTKRRMRCPKCRLAYEVISRSGRRPDCPRCKTPLEDVTATSTVRPAASFDTTRIRQVPPPRPAAPAAAKPGYTCVICDTAFNAKPDVGGRVQCPSCGASFDAK